MNDINELWMDVGDICAMVRFLGGTAYIVGGAARDIWTEQKKGNFGAPSGCKDIDIEVFGVHPTKLQAALEEKYKIDVVGKSFGVIKLHGKPIDISIPRRETKTGQGHGDFEVIVDPTMSVVDAAYRRDFTINSAYFDLLSNTWKDPFNGLADWDAKILRPVGKPFAEDPLRVLRAMQFIARFDLEPTADLLAVCRTLSQEHLPRERVWEEWKKMLLKGKHIGKGLKFLKDIGWVERFYPELHALVGSPQHPEWHPEGWALECASLPSSVAGSAQPCWEDPGLAKAGESFNGSMAVGTGTEPSLSAASAQPVVVSMDNRLSPATTTGSLRSFLTSLTGPAALTKPMPFVWTLSGTALPAQKGSRVVFKITKSCMESIMLSSINDFQIAQGIVGFVAVYVVDMLFPKEFSSKVKFHDQAVDSNAFLSWPENVGVTVMGVDLGSYSIDGQVTCFFEFGSVGNGESVHVYDTIASTKQYQVQIGDVWTHTSLVVDGFTEGTFKDEQEKLVLGLAALCHDLGKPSTAELVSTPKTPELHWTNYGHENVLEPTLSFLARLTNENEIVEQVCALVKAHMKPYSFFTNGVELSTLRRLALQVELQTLAKLVTFDQSGRGPTQPCDPEVVRWFLEKADQANVLHSKPVPLVQGRDLIPLGVKPGKGMGVILKALMEKQLAGEFLTKEAGIEIAKPLILNETEPHLIP